MKNKKALREDGTLEILRTGIGSTQICVARLDVGDLSSGSRIAHWVCKIVRLMQISSHVWPEG